MYLSEQQLQVREMTRNFADGSIRPIAEALDRDETFPVELYKEMAELGLFGIGVPESLGGPGFDTLTYAVVMEELARGYSSVADQCGLVELITSLLVRHGSAAQLKLMPEVLSMRQKVAYCITEAEAGTDVSNVRTVATRDGDLTGLPPTFITTGSRDILNEQAHALADAIAKAGGAVSLKDWPGLWHVFEFYRALPEAEASLTEIAAFLNQHCPRSETKE